MFGRFYTLYVAEAYIDMQIISLWREFDKYARLVPCDAFLQFMSSADTQVYWDTIYIISLHVYCIIHLEQPKS